MAIQTLKFDWQAMYRDLVAVLIETVDSLTEEILREAKSGLHTWSQDSAVKDKTEYEAVKGFVTGQCIFYADAIIDSFGTGEYADRTSQAYWNDYKKSVFFNPSRTNQTIVGRPATAAGKGYLNIWGEEVQSSGKYDGKPLGIKGIKPTRAIQRAEAWIMKDGTTRIERRMELELSKFLAKADKYFIEVGG